MGRKIFINKKFWDVNTKYKSYFFSIGENELEKVVIENELLHWELLTAYLHDERVIASSIPTQGGSLFSMRGNRLHGFHILISICMMLSTLQKKTPTNGGIEPTTPHVPFPREMTRFGTWRRSMEGSWLVNVRAWMNVVSQDWLF